MKYGNVPSPVAMTYEEFLRAKVPEVASEGEAVEIGEINPILKPHQAAIVRWMVAGGRRGCFAAFGLGKTIIQLETMRLITAKSQGLGLIVIPLGVRQEFTRDARMLGMSIKFIRRQEEILGDDPSSLYMTNYETIRDGKLDPQIFDAVSLDEASALRGFGGTKTFREFMARLAGDDRSSGVKGPGIKYRFVATATPSPNQYIELLAYAAFLGIMDVGEAKTRFFKRDSTKADQLTIHPHKEREFWLWVSSWGLFVQKPSDLGYDDLGYDMPPMEVIWHEVGTDHRDAGVERDGQARLFKNSAIGVSNAAREKRDSLSMRIEKMLAIKADNPGHCIIWHDLEKEREAIEKAIPGVRSVYGSQELEDREKLIIGFSDGEYSDLAAKPVMLGSGCNLQRHCAHAIYLGIGFKFNDFVQSLHRIQRFGQTRPVRIDLIYTEAEREVKRALEAKWQRHNELVGIMSDIIREFGLARNAMTGTLVRSIGSARQEVVGAGYRCINNDSVIETGDMAENSVDLIVTSIPFSTQYEYTPSYNDFGHTDNNAHFWEQMDFLTPNLFKVLRPGRVAAIHVKDRIQPGGVNGLGFQTVEPFSDECVAHFKKHGFAFLARKTIVTDVVRENNQTYRLGWSEQLKDGSRMGAGMPEYLLIFRKPPSDLSNGYADVPVRKNRPDYVNEVGDVVAYDGRRKDLKPVIGTGYSRGRWQLDAHGFQRSSGNRTLTSDDLKGVQASDIFKMWREFMLSQPYDYEAHVATCEGLDERGNLPPDFMLLQPASWHPDVWTDVTRMLTLNGTQYAAGKEMHLCPMQFDIADRAIIQYSMPGETVLDPFGGLMTVPYRSVKLGRNGVGIELNPGYWRDGVSHCEAMARELSTPDLFAMLESVAA